MPTLTRSASELADALNPLIRSELTSIATLQVAADRQEEPDYVVLYHETKTEKQANVEQMLALLRAAGAKPDERARAITPVLELQTAMLQRLSTVATLKAMRLVEEALLAEYRALHDRWSGFEQRVMMQPMRRATIHWAVLTAHIAQRQEGAARAEERERLPFPLTQYFAGAEARACMRCHFDRPGEKKALRRGAPGRADTWRPYTFICAACHDEVVAAMPPDLAAQMERWSEEQREHHAIERALGKPEKLRAANSVVAQLAGLEPDLPPTAAELVGDHALDDIVRMHRSPRAAAGRGAVNQIARDRASDDELAYTDLLMDFRSVRRSW